MKIQKRNREKNNPCNVLLIFDDIFGSINNSKVFKDLVSTYRHYNISIIFSAQYVSGSVTYLREISNYIILFNQRTQSALKLAYESYFAAEYAEELRHSKAWQLDYADETKKLIENH